MIERLVENEPEIPNRNESIVYLGLKRKQSFANILLEVILDLDTEKLTAADQKIIGQVLVCATSSDHDRLRQKSGIRVR